MIVIDATASVRPWADGDPRRRHAYVATAGWDPGESTGDFALIELRPVRIQVWDSVEEIEGRTVLRDGAWLDGGATP